MMEAEYKWGGSYPQEITGGRVLEPGETVTLSEDAISDPHNAALIEGGNLFSLDEIEEPQATEAAIELANKHNISLTAITGTGQGGRITQGDVESHIANEEGGA
jgi:pyruvate/2-oxoglutarate dehydrogenase complex dihydrolipoamide acyltransferase (E2) component